MPKELFPRPQNSPEQKKQTLTGVQSSFQSYTGPIPPPAMLEKYNQVVPGAAERILKLAEDQSSHRQNIETIVIKSDSRNSLFGVFSALIISLGVIYLAYFAIKENYPAAGVIFSALGLSSLVGTFIYGTRSRKIERQSRLSDNSTSQ